VYRSSSVLLYVGVALSWRGALFSWEFRLEFLLWFTSAAAHLVDVDVVVVVVVVVVDDVVVVVVVVGGLLEVLWFVCW
jgi:hypothetical protein